MSREKALRRFLRAQEKFVDAVIERRSAPLVASHRNRVAECDRKLSIARADLALSFEEAVAVVAKAVAAVAKS